MGNYTEIDEVKIIEDEAKQISSDIKKLFAYKVSRSTYMPNIDEVIEEKRKKLVNLRLKLRIAENIMGDGMDDRHKNYKRK